VGEGVGLGAASADVSDADGTAARAGPVIVPAAPPRTVSTVTPITRAMNGERMPDCQWLGADPAAKAWAARRSLP
jgi:hypothetical protein